jgi:predicted Zn-dependent peptidase
MVRWGFALFGLVVLSASFPTAGAKKFGDPRKMKIPQLGEIRTPDVERHVLSNDMVVYLLEDHEFPLVDLRAMIRVGRLYEPQPLRGLAAVTGEVLRTGGTASIPGDQLDEKLESMGALIESSIGSTEGIVRGSFLSADASEGLRLFADVLRNPAFPDEKIDLAKVNQRTEIASRNDEPIPIAIREFRKIMWGEHSPYGWHPEYETVETIAREDLLQFHGFFFHPDRIILTASGDFNAPEMLREIEQVFGDWPVSDVPLPPDPPLPSKGPTGVYHAEKGDVTQSTILFGLMGTLASDPDYAALQLLNTILGQGFSSRLINEIRTKRGLAYATGSGAGTGWHHPGIWMCYLLTQADSTLAATQLMRREVERIVAEPVTDVELARAKDAVLNEMVFRLASKREVLNRKAFYEYHGYPSDFLEQYQAKVRSLTTDDLLAAAQRHIRPEEMAVTVVGPTESFDGPLETLGPVTEIDITIPDPPARLEVPEASAEALEVGRAILEDARAAHGAKALDRVATLHEKGSGSMSMMGQAMTFGVVAERILPDRSWAEITIGGMFKIVRVADGDGGWTQTPQGIMDRGPEEIEQGKAERIRSPFHFLTHINELTWQALEPRMFDGVMCDVVYARDIRVKEWLLFFDPRTHLLRGMEYASRGPQGPVRVTEFAGDYRSVGGVQIGHSSRVLHDGEPFMEMTLSEVQVNVEVDESRFVRPE